VKCPFEKRLGYFALTVRFSGLRLGYATISGGSFARRFWHAMMSRSAYPVVGESAKRLIADE
jgi:hypothetical protein